MRLKIKIYGVRPLSVPTVKHVSSAVQWNVKLACVRPRKLVYTTWENQKKKKKTSGRAALMAEAGEKCVKQRV